MGFYLWDQYCFPRYMWTAVLKTKLFCVSLNFQKELIWCLKAALCTANISWSYWKFKDWNKNINVFIKAFFMTNYQDLSQWSWNVMWKSNLLVEFNAYLWSLFDTFCENYGQCFECGGGCWERGKNEKDKHFIVLEITLALKYIYIFFYHYFIVSWQKHMNLPSWESTTWTL